MLLLLIEVQKRSWMRKPISWVWINEGFAKVRCLKAGVDSYQRKKIYILHILHSYDSNALKADKPVIIIIIFLSIIIIIIVMMRRMKARRGRPHCCKTSAHVQNPECVLGEGRGSCGCVCSARGRRSDWGGVRFSGTHATWRLRYEDNLQAVVWYSVR